MDTHPVSGIACPCPGTPHPDGDTVELRARLGLAAGTEIQTLVVQANRAGQAPSEITGLLVEAYVRLGVCGWTFVDSDGAPVDVTAENVKAWILDDFALAEPIAEAADGLYEGPVLGPLVERAASSLPTTPTETSTSPTDSGSQSTPTPFSPSSTSTTPMDDTETTSASPDGDSKWSPIEPMALLRDAG